MGLQNLLLNSDDPIDQVIYKLEDTRNVAKATSLGDSKLYTYAHGLPFTPLCFGTYTDDNWDTSNEYGSAPSFFNSFFNQYTEEFMAIVESDATNVYIRAINWLSTRDFSFRVIGLPPTNAADGMPTVSSLDPFRLNTDNNYMKIFAAGVENVTFGGMSSITIPHNLGYVPTALVFSEVGGTVRQTSAESAVGVTGVYTTSHLTADNLTIAWDSFMGAAKLHYRIYRDE